jgi:hypothetical protein
VSCSNEVSGRNYVVALAVVINIDQRGTDCGKSVRNVIPVGRSSEQRVSLLEHLVMHLDRAPSMSGTRRPRLGA